MAVFHACRTQPVVRYLVLAVLVFLAVVLAADAEEQPRSALPADSSAQPGANPTGSATGRLREGSEISDLLGEFHCTGGRVIFQARDRSVSLQPLQNLALERVSRVLEETRERRLWSVSGIVTEYRGANYLLITRAVLKVSLPTDDKAAEMKPAEKKRP